MSVSHITIIDAARRLTHAPHLMVAGWRADSRKADGCHVTVGDYGVHAVLADAATGGEVLAQLARPLVIVPAVDAIARTMLAMRREVQS